LRRCLGNLVDNALYYGGNADINIQDDSQSLEVTVSDRGPGIPAAQLERVFAPYTRLAGNPSSHPGMGLGLSIARNIARAHGGDITLANREGAGLVARLTLPR
jgi:signal transduction histidine kinase